MNNPSSFPSTTFVLGGARSGKSFFAEERIRSSGLKPFYMATGRANDDEMAERIEKHQTRRGKEWETIEEPLALADAILQTALPGRVLLVDCLSLWITNLMEAGADVGRECESLVEALPKVDAPIVLVSNEVGLGIVPDNKLARDFRDHAGLVNQAVARIADEVWFVASGIAMKMKPQG